MKPCATLGVTVLLATVVSGQAQQWPREGIAIFGDHDVTGIGLPS